MTQTNRSLVGHLPWTVRAMNQAGSALRTLGLPLLPLDPDRLIAGARKRTGLEDLGDPSFRDGLAAFVESLERDAHLTPLGRVVVRTDLSRLLEQRLRMEAEWRAHPEIGEESVVAPIFILGMPRTGTSILHELLAQDPAVRVPMTWEAMFPWPPPERARYDDDPRIAEVARHLSGVDRLLPEFKRMHPMGELLPQECAVLTAYDMRTMVWHTQFRVPGYQDWFEAQDHVATYRGHRRMLQYLQWRCPGAPWVLKSPQHLWALDALLAVYPDARIVQTHRDPLKVVASLTSLVSMLRSMTASPVDPHDVARDWTVRLAAGLGHTMDVRARGLLPESQVYDLGFRDFMKDEVEAIRSMYAHFGMTLSEEAEGRIRAFLAANPKGAHGGHHYRLSDTGLDEATERERYRAYQTRHQVPEEPVE